MNSFDQRSKITSWSHDRVVSNNSRIVSRLWIYLFLLLWTLPLLIGGYEQQSLKVHDEALYATRARLMLDTGDWVNPWLVLHHKTPRLQHYSLRLYPFTALGSGLVLYLVLSN